MHEALTRRHRHRLWQRSRKAVDALELPVPFDAAAFIGMLARDRGRPIELVPVTARPNAPCGLLVSTGSTDWILYAADTTALHRQHILLHEAAHLLCAHQATAPLAEAARALLPNLPPALILRVLGRTVYSEPQEAEAELVASLILSRAARLARTRSEVPPSADAGEVMLRSLFAALYPPGRRGHDAHASPGGHGGHTPPERDAGDGRAADARTADARVTDARVTDVGTADARDADARDGDARDAGTLPADARDGGTHD